VNNNNGPRNETMCREVTSSQSRLEEHNAIRGGSDPLASCTRASEQIDERDVNRPVHVREIGRRGDNRSQSDSSSSSSDESGGRRSPDRRSPEEVGRQRVSEKRRSPTELGRHGSSEYRQSLEDLRTEFSEELRAQKAMFLNARAEFGEMFGELRAQLVDREARQEDILAHALSVFEDSMASIKSPAGADSSNEDRPARSRG